MKRVFLSITVVLMFVTGSYATNGMEMIGYGARSSSMGGISQALTRCSCSINNNPALIGSITEKQLSASVGLLIPSVYFSNGLNDEDGDSKVFPLPSIAYIHGNESKLRLGIGFFAQGGMGATYPGLTHDIFREYDQNPMTPDDPYVTKEYHSQIAYMKFIPAVSYQATPKLSVGFSPNIGFALLEMQMPYSINPMQDMKGEIPGMGGMTFGGMFGGPMDQGGLGYDEVTAYADLGEDGVTSSGFGAKVGIHFQANDKLAIGASYTIKSTLNFEGNATTMDMNAQFGHAYERMVGGAMQSGMSLENAQNAVNTQLQNMGIDMSLGMLAKYDAEIEFSWPQEAGFGMTYQATEKLMVGADARWINWKDSMEKFVMDFKNGDSSNINTMMGSSDIHLEMPLEWDDQIVIAVGGEYFVTPKLALRAGFNYASNPVPEETIIPIFPAVVESHITMGFGYKVTPKFTIHFAYEHNPEKELEVGSSKIANEYDGSKSSLKESVFHLTTAIKF